MNFIKIILMNLVWYFRLYDLPGNKNQKPRGIQIESPIQTFIQVSDGRELHRFDLETGANNL